MFRPPRLDDWPVPGEPPIEFAAPSAEVPVPLTTPRPTYPPAPAADEVVLVESHVEIDGRVTEAKCLSGSSSFCPAALTAAHGWTFLPAQRDGEPVPAFVYIAFGFRRPR
jgi:protein TonB